MSGETYYIFDGFVFLQMLILNIKKKEQFTYKIQTLSVYILYMFKNLLLI